MKKNLLNFKEQFIYLSHHFYGKKNRSGEQKKTALLLSSAGNAHGLFYPFHFYRRELAEELNFHFKEIISDNLNEKKKQIETFKGDFIFISVPLRVHGNILPKRDVLCFFQAIQKPKDVKLFFFDISDQPISPYFEVLPYVDLFLMPFIFKNKDNYFKSFLSGNQFADFMSKKYNIPPTRENEYHTDLFYSQPIASEIDKIQPIWNWMLWRRMINLFKGQSFRCLKSTKRPIDVHSRFTSYEGWCRLHRKSVYDHLENLSPPYKIIASEKKIDIHQYYQELEKTKISFSPFGYGEICPKDYEAIIKGCLLVKPSVEHLVTCPQIHLPHETYIPVAWDLSDMETVIIDALLDHEKREKIIHNASQLYEKFFAEKGFLRIIESLLNRIIL